MTTGVIEEHDHRLSFIPLDELTIPPRGLIRVIKNSYWVIHPDKGAVIWKTLSPQCNTDIALIRRTVGEGGHYPWAVMAFIPLAYLPIQPQDYV